MSAPPRSRRRRAGAAIALAAALGAAGCGGGGAPAGRAAAPPARTPTQVQVIRTIGASGFDPPAIYRRDAPSVVTIVSVFPNSPSSLFFGGGPQAGQGSGFVVSADGEIATNAHVVTNGERDQIKRADQVFVIFGDGHQVPARIVGFDPNADVALLKVSPAGLRLRPLALGSARDLQVGAPVAAIGSPFDQEQSLSIGVISATNRAIDSLTGFGITGAIQTDAAINHGNSGGPLLDASGRVLGINSQIKSSGGGGEGVGFAVPADLVRRSLDQLRRTGHVRYAYLGISTASVFPELGQRFDLGTPAGAWVQSVVRGGPADHAGLRAASGPPVRFQFSPYQRGGDVIVAVGGRPVRNSDDLGQLLQGYDSGQAVDLQVVRSKSRQTVTVRVGERPANPGSQRP